MPSKPNQPAVAKRRKARFAPVPTRKRHDGWTPERQHAFIEALAASACVEEACRTVGMSSVSAYRLRARLDAQSFRLAWDAAIDFGIRRLSDAVLSRAINGTPVPHYYQGEQVGEHRRYDNRLAQFLLRYRDPLRYAATLDHMVYSGDPEGAVVRLARLSAQVDAGVEGFDVEAGLGGAWRHDMPPSLARVREDAARLARERACAEADERREEGDRLIERIRAGIAAIHARRAEQAPASEPASEPEPEPAPAPAPESVPPSDLPSGRGMPRVTWG